MGLGLVIGALDLKEVPVPEPRPGSALVRIEATALMSYLRAYVEGKLPFYNPPKGEFTIGTNGVGVVEAVGRDVWRLKPGRNTGPAAPRILNSRAVFDPNRNEVFKAEGSSCPSA